MEEIILNQEIKPLKLAGFWLRFVAFLIDFIIIELIFSIVLFPFKEMLNNSNFSFISMIYDSNTEGLGTYLGLAMLSNILGLTFYWLYYALMETYYGATLGKMIFGLKVTDLYGNKINFFQATLRFLGKIISVLTLYIGFIMAGFTEKKQALHDIIANCLVIKK